MSKVSLDDMFPGTTDRLMDTGSIDPKFKKWLVRPPRDIDGQVLPFQPTNKETSNETCQLPTSK